jgi:hypothetical protein
MNIEREIFRNIQNEGIGSVYERIILKRFFERLSSKYSFDSVLEYGCKITKGYDNLVFMKRAKVTLFDSDIETISKNWCFKLKPEFSSGNLHKKYDLVWNFAILQQEPRIITIMKNLSRRYILIIVPNILNYGTPIHLAYHFFTRTECKHAERGNLKLRTRLGLKRFTEKNGIKILECDYIDMPPIPDIGFSIKELLEFLGCNTKNERSLQNIDAITQKIEKMMVFENKNLPSIIRAFFGHHIFLFGEV